MENLLNLNVCNGANILAHLEYFEQIYRLTISVSTSNKIPDEIYLLKKLTELCIVSYSTIANPITLILPNTINLCRNLCFIDVSVGIQLMISNDQKRFLDSRSVYYGNMKPIIVSDLDLAKDLFF